MKTECYEGEITMIKHTIGWFTTGFGVTLGVACGVLFVSFASKTYSKFMSKREADELCKESTVTD